jgi:hypothetical protein
VRSLRPLAAASLAAAIAGGALGTLTPAAQAYRLEGIPWPGRPAQITYWNGTAYGAQVARAVRAWNASGARVRFRQAPKRSAQLRIVYAGRSVTEEFGIPFGLASVGYQPRNRVEVGRGARGVGVLGVIAHELGHVLGLVHDDGRCALLNTRLWSRCLGAPPCSLLQLDDVRGAIRRYGGRVRARAPDLCPPTPGTFDVGRDPATGRVRATVTVPDGDVAGIIVRRSVGRCPERPATVAEGRTAASGTLVAVDVTPRGTIAPGVTGELCVRAWSFDATGRVSATPATRRVPLPAPVPS